MRKTVTALLASLTLALPVANGLAAIRTSSSATATKRKVVVTRKVVGSAAQADRWGTVQVALSVRKTTTTTTGSRKTVTRRIVAVSATGPNHTARSAYISERAIPYLRQEVLAAQFNSNINLVSGATDLSQAFVQSLQSAVLLAQRV